MIHFNNNKLKERIKASGLKSNYIADSLGLHKQTISFYLTGRRTPKKETLKEIAKLCRCKLGDFYDTKEEAEAREHQNNS
jgi:transcriptional regulator with XRE-family HTH domain